MARSRSAAGRGSREPIEWVGGRVLSPGYVQDGGPHRPEIFLWFELPSSLVVGMDVVDRRAPISFGESLRRALEEPQAGPPRTPDRVRVARGDLADEVREVVGPAVAVEVAPTPEIDALAADFRRHLAEDEDEDASDLPRSYLEGGRLPEDAVGRLFAASGELFRQAPWKKVDDEQFIQVDVPELGVEGACVSLIGAMGESFGFVMFPSRLACEAYLSAIDAGLPEKGEPVDLGTDHLALNFEKRKDVRPELVREAAAHGWALASNDAYPLWMCVDRDAVLRPIEPREIDALAATCLALARLFEGRADAVAKGESAEAQARLPGSAATATARFPYRPSAPRPVLGPRADAPAQSIVLEMRLTQAMWGTARHRLGKRWEAVKKSVKGFHNHLPFAIPWAVYRYRTDGRRVVDWFLEEAAGMLNEPERAWLEAQATSWLGAWEVEAVDPGVSLALRDLFTGERRDVVEKRGSEGVGKGQVLYAAVVEYRGVSLLTGTYSHTLPPIAAEEVVRTVARALKVEPGKASVAQMREEEAEKLLLATWQKTVREHEKRREKPPRLVNAEGDGLLFTRDHFAFVAGERARIEAAVRTLGEAVDEVPGEGEERLWDVLGGEGMMGGRSVLGRIAVGEGALRIETNSKNRADELRARVEQACGPGLRHRLREHTDPLSEALGKVGNGERPVMTPEMQQAMREHKAQYYRTWMDMKIPALGGKTPRQAAKSADGRRRLEALLKEMELLESQLPEGERADVAAVRRELLGG